MNFIITGIDVLSFSSRIVEASRLRTDNLNVRISITALPVYDNQNLVFSFTIEYHFADRTEGEPGIMQIEVSLKYAYDNAIGLFNTSDSPGIILQKEELKAYLSLSYTTIRGIFFEKVRGTQLHSFYIPIINPEFLYQKFVEVMDEMKEEIKAAVVEIKRLNESEYKA